MPRTPRYRLCASLLIIALALAGCATGPSQRVAQPGETELLKSAHQAEERGDYQAAARAYLDLAAAASALKGPEYQLQAAAALIRGNYIDRAQRVLDGIDVAKLHVRQLLRRQLLAARIALAANRPDRALDLLHLNVPADAPSELQAELHELRADAYLRSGNLLEAARERVLREPFLDPADREARVANQQAIWQTLMQLSDDALLQLRSAPPPDVFTGWLDLAHIGRVAQRQPLNVAERIAAWRELYPQHPASDEIIALLLARQQEETRRPAHIALLLPQSGAYAGAAAALRDGFLSAHYTRGNRGYDPSITVYDVGPEPDAVNAVYERAVADGAEFVVGPLQKETVNRLVASERITVPTLTLNYAEDAAPNPEAPLYQFGLAPEDEARQLAERAWLDGRNHALAIVPDSDWGRRVLQAFAQDWQQLGGTLLESQSYPQENSDFAPQLKSLLNLDESEQRHAALEALLQQRLNYEPRRREDADFIFMAAFPRQARLIRPQLRFHYAGGLPVYSTSHVYTGKRDRNADGDMDGVVFCDIPWVLAPDGEHRALKQQIARLWPEQSEQYVRFFALGIDAYNIIPFLNNLRAFRYERFTGETGVLQLDDGNRVFRRLQWARFSDGLPRPYN